MVRLAGGALAEIGGIVSKVRSLIVVAVEVVAGEACSAVELVICLHVSWDLVAGRLLLLLPRAPIVPLPSTGE